MARTRRLKINESGTAYYHLVSRTNNKRFLFSDGNTKTALVDILKPATPAKGSIGVYSLPGSNDESARNRYNKVCVGGLHTGFVFNEVDHLVMTGCMAARCVYGYWFERGSPKTTTMINCCDEGCAHLPRFRGRGHLTAIDFNIERFSAAFIPDDPDGDGEHAAVEEQPGGWSGYISYTLQGSAYGLGTGNFKPGRFWRDGVNFWTVDHNAGRLAK